MLAPLALGAEPGIPFWRRDPSLAPTVIRYFKTFLIAAETSSFSAAGARLGLTQSAVSTQIRRLEDDLGCTLFERSGKSVTLSEEGRQMLADATRIVSIYEAMKGSRERDTAPLDLGAVSTVQASLLPRAMQRFRVAYPDTHVNIVPGMSTQLLTQVDARELDIAVLVKPRLGIPTDLKWVPLLQERFVAVAPTGAPSDLKNAAAERAVYPLQPPFHRWPTGRSLSAPAPAVGTRGHGTGRARGDPANGWRGIGLRDHSIGAGAVAADAQYPGGADARRAALSGDWRAGAAVGAQAGADRRADRGIPGGKPGTPVDHACGFGCGPCGAPAGLTRRTISASSAATRHAAPATYSAGE